ncbi:MAG: zinc ABC transporter substrate-binding protein, partial [Anaerolineaceae bacterium]|nr:zinc ABC transporter substrate-binding protein [Anaerolineaceae bacterium]
MFKRIIVILLAIPLFLSACTTAEPGYVKDNDKIVVSVSILPQAYFVERIGGTHVFVNVMVGTGSDPHSYEPTPIQMRALAESQLYFSIGVEFEAAWLPRFKATNPDLLIVDTIAGIIRIPISDFQQGEVRGEPDPHVWLSPALVKEQGQKIVDALISIDPAHEPDYQINFSTFIEDVNELDETIRSELSSLQNKKFITTHPVWGYFARDYNLVMVSIEVTGQEPSAEEMALIIDIAREAGITQILAQREYSGRSAQALASEIGASVVILDPLAKNWLENMK